ncbi:MAG: S41 family peptidase [Acidobacteriota bacterium]
MISAKTRWIIIVIFVLALAGLFAFGQQPKAPALDAARKQAVVDEIAELLNKNYIFLETAKTLEDALRGQLRSGAFDKFDDARAFAQAVSSLLLDVGKDKHMGFVYNPAVAEDLRRMRGRSEEEARKVRERQLQESRRDNFGFRKVERLAGNIGYLDFRGFMSPDQAGPTAVAAMNFLAYCDAIIIDLRQNGGGDPAQIQLISSYFFGEPAHLNDLYYRAEDRTENYWTLPFVPGAKPVNADLYILTSARSFSGAEEFTYNMKNLKRATVIGETTGGGAHPTNAMIVQKDFILRVPYGRAINPVSKTNWEGTGVTPDIAVPAAEAFDKAYALAVEKLAAKATDPERKAEYDWLIAGMKAKANPPRLDDKTLKSYAGVYGERKITLENGALFYQRTGPKYRLVPLTSTLFAPDGLDNFRVEFVIKDGRAVELVGLYDNGERQPSPRTK